MNLQARLVAASLRKLSDDELRTEYAKAGNDSARESLIRAEAAQRLLDPTETKQTTAGKMKQTQLRPWR